MLDSDGVPKPGDPKSPSESTSFFGVDVFPSPISGNNVSRIASNIKTRRCILQNAEENGSSNNAGVSVVQRGANIKA